MKLRDLILIAGAAVFLGVLSIGTLLSPDVAFSANENRYLQQIPEISVQNILSGRFSEDAEEYFSDQILDREKWVSGKNLIEAAVGVRDINGVYLCEDGRVVQRITEDEFDWEQYEQNLQEIVQLSENLEGVGIPVDLMIVPTAAYVYQESLPAYAIRFDEDKAFQKAKDTLGEQVIDLRDTLEATKKPGTFFKTDHHWTNYGAFLGYRAYEEHQGRDISGLTYESTEPEILTTEFKGTLYSKVLLPTLGIDSILTPAAALDAEYMVMMDGEMQGSLYFREYLEEKDKYAVFFGGNYDKVDISMENPESEEELLIIKDSFANSFVPYLLDEYERITMVDTRYYRHNISELALEYDRVLVLYSITNMAEQRLMLTGGLVKD